MVVKFFAKPRICHDEPTGLFNSTELNEISGNGLSVIFPTLVNL